MPGIVGLITKRPRKHAEEELQRMVQAIRHEPFYASGTFVDDSLGTYVGWTAHEHSFAAQMPVRNERHDISLIFSGEEYPDPGIIDSLRLRGHTVATGGPSYLVHSYEEDTAFPRGLNGIFHGMIVDARLGVATLFNDKFGMHRLYYYESKDTFYFAAELKAILAVRPDLRVVDPRALGEFVACSCVLDDRTLFKDIFVLPQAAAWTFRNGVIDRKVAYFQPKEWEDQPSLAPESFYREIRDVLATNLPRYFDGRERIGIALTGGLDTRVIMALHKGAPGTFPSYTFGGMLRVSEDVRVARQVATLCGQRHDVISVGNEFLSRFPHYAERTVYLTEGGLDVYHASDLYVSEKARSIAPVKVVGTYGSELLQHIVMLSPITPPTGLYSHDFIGQIALARETCDTLRRQHPVTFAAFRQSPWYHHGILGLEATQLTVRSPYLDNDFVRTVYRAPSLNGSTADIRLRLVRDVDSTLAQLPTDRGVGGDSGRLISTARRAWLDFTVKAEYAYDHGMPQWLARVDYLLAPLRLHSAFLGRHKLTHFRVWYQGTLADYVREVLLDTRSLARPYISRSGVEGVVSRHIKGSGNHTREIHKLLTLEHLHRLYVDAA